jgi:ABC-type proline/glycine betaine transport system permease subunit
MIDVPVAAIVFAVLFAVLGWLASRRHDIVTPATLVILFVIELAFIPTYERNTTADWIIQLAVAVASTVGLVTGILAIRDSRQSKPA